MYRVGPLLYQGHLIWSPFIIVETTKPLFLKNKNIYNYSAELD